MEDDKLQEQCLHILAQLDSQIKAIRNLCLKNFQKKEALAIRWNNTAWIAAIIGLSLFTLVVFFALARNSTDWITVIVSGIPGVVSMLFFVRVDSAYRLADEALKQFIKEEEQAVEKKITQLTDLLVQTARKEIQEKHAPDIARMKLRLSLREQERLETEESSQRKKLILAAIISCLIAIAAVVGWDLYLHLQELENA